MAATLAFYLERAAEAGRAAEAATLDNVRDRARRAEAAWLAMANRVERTQTGREAVEAEKMAARMNTESA